MPRQWVWLSYQVSQPCMLGRECGEYNLSLPLFLQCMGSLEWHTQTQEREGERALATVHFVFTVPYPVKVMTLSGQSSEFMVRGGELVRDLKEKICLVHSIPVPEQRLIFKQQELPDSNTLTSLQILCGATLSLVLVTSEMHSPTTTPCYTCAGVTPTISIHHFIIGLCREQLACIADIKPFLQSPGPMAKCIATLQSPGPVARVALPPHITHIVHTHDSLHSGFRMFLRYLYCRKLPQKDESKPSCITALLGAQAKFF